MSKKDKKAQKTPATATPATKKTADKSPAAKGKLKIRELTEEEAGEVVGGLGGLAAFCQGA